MPVTAASDLVTSFDAVVSVPRYDQLYSDYDADVIRIYAQIDRELARLPSAMRDIASFYFERRLRATSRAEGGPISPLVGRPVPFLAFWLCDDLGIGTPDRRRDAGLAIILAAAAASARDDLLDGTTASVPGRLVLAERLWNRQAALTRSVAGGEAPAIAEVLLEDRMAASRHEAQSTFIGYSTVANPLRSHALWSASAYLVSVCYPTLAAAALCAGRGDLLRAIRSFLRRYCMGWRLVDDMRDISADLASGAARQSSLLSFIAWRLGIDAERLDRPTVVAALLERDILVDVYREIDGHYRSAEDQARLIGSVLLHAFVRAQRVGHRLEQARYRAARPLDGLVRSLTSLPIGGMATDSCSRVG